MNAYNSDSLQLLTEMVSGGICAGLAYKKSQMVLEVFKKSHTILY